MLFAWGHICCWLHHLNCWCAATILQGFWHLMWCLNEQLNIHKGCHALKKIETHKYRGPLTFCAFWKKECKAWLLSTLYHHLYVLVSLQKWVLCCAAVKQVWRRSGLGVPALCRDLGYCPVQWAKEWKYLFLIKKTWVPELSFQPNPEMLAEAQQMLCGGCRWLGTAPLLPSGGEK